MVGVQQGLLFVVQVFLNEGDIVLMENLGYFGVLFSFCVVGVFVFGVFVDEDGLCVEDVVVVLVQQ